MQIKFPKKYEVIVVGAGHAGCEAALAASRMGIKTLLATMNIETTAQLSCNPAVGGPGKGHVAREIDALGGQMAKVIDCAGVQFRMLNTKKGPAVWAPRAQLDKQVYQDVMLSVIENQPNLELMQLNISGLLIEKNQIRGIKTQSNLVIFGKIVIVTAGTFLNGLIHVGMNSFSGGRLGEFASTGISESLIKHGFRFGRLKTGTPARIHAKSIDYSLFQEQKGARRPQAFSYGNQLKLKQQIKCYLGYTTKKTHQIIKRNMHKSPLYSGKIKGTGVRYCPSIEDKVVRFAEKDRHQIFLEPEGKNTAEVYINGLSTSFPQDVQIKMLKTIPGLERAQILRFGYGIEYDYFDPTQIFPTMETKIIKNLFLAGQVNGTTGYEEAACQGLIAGINAALKIQKKEPFVLQRSEAYIGVLIDDLVTKGTTEPYRLFTSRVEHRLILRQDNADLRLSENAYKFGLLSKVNIDKIRTKQKIIFKEIEKLKNLRQNNTTLAKILKRPDVNFKKLRKIDSRVGDLAGEIASQVEIEIKYEGYIQRETKLILRLKKLENKKIPAGFPYQKIKGLKKEAIEKLVIIKPITVGQAMRISGITSSDISLLLLNLKN